MYTLGYSFKPWREAKAIADGPSILNYVRETAAEYGVDKHIRYRHQVKRASWSSETATWTVEVERGGPARRPASPALSSTCAPATTTTRPATPPSSPASRASADGSCIPQFWPEDIDYTGKKVVVIGSGATAVTLVPEMAKTAGHVTMLQRSPTYVVSRPAEDRSPTGCAPSCRP
jgi:monooxygenase